MNSLPKAIHDRLRSEFRVAASKVAEARDVRLKNYYFSVFYGDVGRQLNLHWDPDLALLWSVINLFCQSVNARLAQAEGPFPLGGFPEGFLQAMDEIGEQLAVALERDEIDMARIYAALARTAELAYIITGNGAYLYDKGMVKL